MARVRIKPAVLKFRVLPATAQCPFPEGMQKIGGRGSPVKLPQAAAHRTLQSLGNKGQATRLSWAKWAFRQLVL